MNGRDDDLLKRVGEYARKRQRDEALTPLPDAFHEQVSEKIGEALGDDAPESDEHDTRRRPHRAWMALAASVVAAVGLTLWLGRAPQSPSLPPYSIELRAGADTRSGAALNRYDIGDRLDVILRPDTAVDARLEAIAYRLDAGRLTPLALAPPRWSAEGAARFVTTLDGLAPLAAGKHELVFVLAPAGQLPSAQDVFAGLGARDPPVGDGYRVLRAAIELAGQ